MSRYGWSRESVSPYTSLSGGIPAVTDDDFSYITSQDLEDHSLGAPEDDVLIVKHRGNTLPTRFPAYAIGDGKLLVGDVRDRVGLLMGISDRATRHMKLLYKGKQLKDLRAPIRDYGVKNNSQLMAVLPEFDDPTSPSEGEEMVVVGEPDQEKKSRSSKKKNRSKKRTDKGDSGSYTASSPRDSNSTLDAPKSPTIPAEGPMRKLEEIAADFDTHWLPTCEEYIANTPTDARKREDDHRKYTESIMQHVLLKLDSVDSEGVAEVRARRKAMIKLVQDTLKRLDVAKES